MRRAKRVVSTVVALCMAATMVAPAWAAAPTADAPYGYRDEMITFTAQKDQNVWADANWGSDAIDKAFDGADNTYYESNKSNVIGNIGADKVKIAWKYDEEVTIDKLQYTPRQDTNKKGAWVNFTVYGSDQEITKLPDSFEGWRTLYTGENVNWDSISSIDFDFKKPETVKSVCVEVSKARTNGNTTVSAAEIKAYKKTKNNPVEELEIDKSIMSNSAEDNSHQYDSVQGDGNIKSAFDNNIDGTFWHSRWDGKLNDGTTPISANNPAEIKWNLVENTESEKVYPNKLVYRGRNYNGDWKQVRISVTDDVAGKGATTGWTTVYEGAVEQMTEQKKDIDIVFQKVLPATAMKVEILDGRTDAAPKIYANAANIKVYRKLVSVYGAGLTLNDGVVANIKYNFSEEVKADENAQVVLSVDGKQVETYKVSDVVNQNNIVSVPVSVRQMTDEIKLEVKSGNVVLDTVTTSVRKIADQYLASEFNHKDKTKIQTLVKNMLNYGAQMQTYKGYKTNNLANKGLDEVDMSTAEAGIKAYTSEVTNTTGVKVRPSLQLRDKTAVGFYFPKSDAESWTFKQGETALKAEPKGDYIYVESLGINPQMLNQQITLTVNDNTTVTYSPMNYAKVMFGQDTNLDNVLKAMYVYNQAAVAMQ